MMSKAAKEALSKTVEMPEMTKEILRYSDLEYAVLCYLFSDVPTEDEVPLESDLRRTQEVSVIEVDSLDIEESVDVVIDDCDEVVEVALRSLAPRAPLSRFQLV